MFVFCSSSYGDALGHSIRKASPQNSSVVGHRRCDSVITPLSDGSPTISGPTPPPTVPPAAAGPKSAAASRSSPSPGSAAGRRPPSGTGASSRRIAASGDRAPRTQHRPRAVAGVTTTRPRCAEGRRRHVGRGGTQRPRRPRGGARRHASAPTVSCARRRPGSGRTPLVAIGTAAFTVAGDERAVATRIARYAVRSVPDALQLRPGYRGTGSGTVAGPRGTLFREVLRPQKSQPLRQRIARPAPSPRCGSASTRWARRHGDHPCPRSATAPQHDYARRWARSTSTSRFVEVARTQPRPPRRRVRPPG